MSGTIAGCLKVSCLGSEACWLALGIVFGLDGSLVGCGFCVWAPALAGGLSISCLGSEVSW